VQWCPDPNLKRRPAPNANSDGGSSVPCTKGFWDERRRAPSMRMERLFMWMAVVGVIGVVLTRLGRFCSPSRLFAAWLVVAIATYQESPGDMPTIMALFRN